MPHRRAASRTSSTPAIPNNIIYNTPAGGANSVVFTPGNVADSGTITGNAFGGAALTPLAFSNLGGGTVTFTTSNVGRSDILQVNGTAAGENFLVTGSGDGGAGTVHLLTLAGSAETPVLQTPAINALLLDGNGGVDVFNLSRQPAVCRRRHRQCRLHGESHGCRRARHRQFGR